LKPANGSWRVDETYNCQGGNWRYLSRAVDSIGATIDFWFSLSVTRLRPSGSSRKPSMQDRGWVWLTGSFFQHSRPDRAVSKIQEVA
jgi:hypothetical protein